MGGCGHDAIAESRIGVRRKACLSPHLPGVTALFFVAHRRYGYGLFAPSFQVESYPLVQIDDVGSVFLKQLSECHRLGASRLRTVL